MLIPAPLIFTIFFNFTWICNNTEGGKYLIVNNIFGALQK